MRGNVRVEVEVKAGGEVRDQPEIKLEDDDRDEDEVKVGKVEQRQNMNSDQGRENEKGKQMANDGGANEKKEDNNGESVTTAHFSDSEEDKDLEVGDGFDDDEGRTR